MHIFKCTVVAALCSFVAANALSERAPTCTKNACYSVVKKNHQKDHSMGCTAFLRKTVTPATVTSTSTSTVYAEVLLTVTSISTSLSTAQPSTTSTSTITSTTTSIKTVDTTTTTTITQAAAMKRRAAGGPVTNSQTTVPAYATSACRNTLAYSSACTCNGYTKVRPRTVATPTTSTTVTTSGLIKLISTSVTTLTSTTTGTDTVTIVKTETNVVTTASTTTSTTTVTATATPTPSYYFQIKVITQEKPIDPTLNNKYVFGSRLRNPNDNTVVRSGGPVTPIQVNTDGTVTITDGTVRYFFSTASLAGGQVLSRTSDEVAAQGAVDLSCQLDSANKLVCVKPTDPLQPATLQYCQCTLELNDLHVTYDGSVEDQCLAVDLVASPAS